MNVDTERRSGRVSNIADDIHNAYEEGYKCGRFDALDAISSVYYGKQYYFREDNGLIYSRDSCKYLTLEEAIYEFADKFGDDGVGY